MEGTGTSACLRLRGDNNKWREWQHLRPRQALSPLLFTHHILLHTHLLQTLPSRCCLLLKKYCVRLPLTDLLLLCRPIALWWQLSIH